MDFHSKIQKLAADVNQSKVARNVGLKPNVFATYLAKKAMPRADIAAKMAKALGVPLDWLLDDSRGWPPPKGDAEKSAFSLSDQQLIHELARRFRGVLIDFLAEVERAKVVDWKSAAREISLTPQDKPLSDASLRAMRTLGSINVKFSRLRQDFDVNFYAMVHHAELPGADRPIAEMESEQASWAWQAIEEMPYVEQVAQAMSVRPEWQASPLKVANDQYRANTLSYLQGMEAQSQKATSDFEQRRDESHKPDKAC